jgi:hypothetical protein
MVRTFLSHGRQALYLAKLYGARPDQTLHQAILAPTCTNSLKPVRANWGSACRSQSGALKIRWAEDLFGAPLSVTWTTLHPNHPPHLGDVRKEHERKSAR